MAKATGQYTISDLTDGTALKYYGTRSWTQSQCNTYFVIGYSGTWTQPSPGVSCRKGDSLYIDVTNTTTGKKQILYLEATADNDGSSSITAKVTSFTTSGTDGTNGTSPLQAVLTNESHTLTADSSGVPTSYTGCSTTITVYQGTTDVTSQYTIARTNPNGVSSSLSGNTVTVTEVTNGTGGTITITATKGSTVLTKGFAISISKAGSDGSPGSPGTPAKLVTVNPSVQTFKSTTGQYGTFTPQYIYLYPTFQSCTYSKWQYSTDGTTWNNVTSGQHSLTIGTYNSVANSLRIERTCDLYTSSISAITFKCVATETAYYDTTTITKLYDVTGLQIGGTNLVLMSRDLSGTPTSTDRYISSYNNNNKIKRSDGFTASRITDTTAWKGISFKGESLGLKVGDEITYSFDIQSVGYTSNLTFYAMIFNSGGTRLQGEYLGITYNGYSVTGSSCGMHAIASGDKRREYITIKWLQAAQDVIDAGGTINMTIQESSASMADENSYLDMYAPKVEKGNVPTDWSPAPEDLESQQVVRSANEPSNPYVGMLWFNTTNGSLQYCVSVGVDPVSGDPVVVWETRDLSEYALQSSVDAALQNKNQVFVDDTVTPPYNPGDMWIITNENDENYGKILTCVYGRLSTETYHASDWIVPLTAYTTVTEMTNVLGTDPREWSSSSKSVTQMINENTGKIEGTTSELANLTVRASDIAMSFSKTGTMNFLGNSSGQNGLASWTISPTGKVSVRSSASADVGQNIVSGNVFAIDTSTTVTMTSDLFIPPTSNTFTISAKVRMPSIYSFVTFTVYLYSDLEGNTQIGTKSFTAPYSQNAENTYILYHQSVHKSDYNAQIRSAKLVIEAKPINVVSVPSGSTPQAECLKIENAGKTFSYNSKYYYVKPIYQELMVNDFTSAAEVSSPRGDTVYRCRNNIYYELAPTVIQYAQGIYYTNRDNAASATLRAVSDTYFITLLDSNDLNYYVLTSQADNLFEYNSQPSTSGSTVYIGDIMVNGGDNVQTWTPRQDENLWGENIKFSSTGIQVINNQEGYGRTLDSHSDVAYKLNSDGTIVAYIWKLNDSGFITKDIKCYGTFSMGTANESSADIDDSFIKVLEMKRNQDNTGVDDYIFTS